SAPQAAPRGPTRERLLSSSSAHSIQFEVIPGRVRGPHLGWAVCSAAWTPKGDPTWPSGIGWCSLLMCNQQGRTGGIATRLYVDSGLVGISGRDDGGGGRQSLDDSD